MASSSSLSRGPPKPLITSDTIVRVTSTLDKTTHKRYLTDGSPETCWASANGLPQAITLTFPHPILPQELKCTFAGGFVGTHCSLSSRRAPPSGEGGGQGAGWEVRARFYPEDVNRRQRFPLELGPGGEEGKAEREWKVEFEKGSDFFGRVTVYEFEVWGWEVSEGNA